MKRIFIISVVLLLSLYARDIYKLSIWVDYSINVVSITDEHCVNKSDVDLHCNGKCHLEKQLNYVDGIKESPEKPSIPKSLDERIELIVSENIFKLSAVCVEESKVVTIFRKLNINSGFLCSIDHPPKIIA